MSSQVRGFKYDIFISYRQKDNKGGWVSDFVEALKTELESAFKDDVSVYFDINPHDGLLETHDVDASLKEKLKCFIFIPIISRTYCDPRSFAWEHEFNAFINQASTDEFGLKIKLPDGNIACRILPVLIHDLDTEDKKLIQIELGGILRGIEFIYKEPGVNRPLLMNEDHPDHNLKKLIYRNQINKVANAVRDIITAIKNPVENGETLSEKSNKEYSQPLINKQLITIGRIFVLIIIIFTVLFIINISTKSNGKPSLSIAVLPLHNYSEDSNQEIRSDALTNDIINHLFKIKSFDRVVPFSSVLPYKRSDKKYSRIATELNVNYIIGGIYQRIGDSLRITVNLLEQKSDKYLWQNDYHKPYKDIISITSDIALQIAEHVNAFLTVKEKENIEKIPTSNLEAFELVQQAWIATARSFEFDKMKNQAQEAILLDPNYADAYAAAGAASLYQGIFIGQKDLKEAIWTAQPFIEKALDLDPDNSLAHLLMGNINEWGRWNYIKAEEEYLKVHELSPNFSSSAMTFIMEFYFKMNVLENALESSKKIQEKDRGYYSILLKTHLLSGNQRETNDYLNSLRNISKIEWVGEAYIWLEKFDSARYCFEYALEQHDTLMYIPRFQANLALSYYKTGQSRYSWEIINKLKEKSKINSAGSPEYFIGWYYSGINEMDSAFAWLEKAYNKTSSEMPYLKVHPVFKNLKNDQRYLELYQKTGHKAWDDYKNASKK